MLTGDKRSGSFHDRPSWEAASLPSSQSQRSLKAIFVLPLKEPVPLVFPGWPRAWPLAGFSLSTSDPQGRLLPLALRLQGPPFP